MESTEHGPSEHPPQQPLPGLPAPPPLGASALPPGTYAGRTVLVTGGGTGLGKAIAAEFARLGAHLVIVGRRAGQLQQAVAELGEIAAGAEAAGGAAGGADAGRADDCRADAGGADAGRADAGAGRITAAVCDIRDPERIAEVFDAAVAASGLPDVLVNNAAANFPVPAEDMSPNAWRAVVDVTLTGTWLTTREFGRRHLAAGTPGSILNIGASYAWTGGPGFAHSAAAKAGVKSLTETLAVEWGPYGIQVNGLVPGLVPHSDMTADIRAGLARDEGPAALRQPALRVGLPRELGWAATFLASPYASFITGHTLVVDGANWQRRSLVNPEVTPLREQLGRGPFSP
ncbi:SDR family oxidoreductase [Streptomyces sp. NPDC101118]|uniref:SDR family oxidoreductase n=1 Tax=Streptomyces sp. NPDC101118 TaxID=3366109 RepID=UPI0038028B57